MQSWPIFYDEEYKMTATLAPMFYASLTLSLIVVTSCSIIHVLLGGSIRAHCHNWSVDFNFITFSYLTVDQNECLSNPCMNQGTCLDERGGYRCLCMPGKSMKNMYPYSLYGDCCTQILSFFTYNCHLRVEVPMKHLSTINDRASSTSIHPFLLQ